MRTVFFTLPALVAIAVGSLFFPGQLSCFVFFSLTFFAVLYSAFLLPFQYSHLFLAVPWFLGLWLKLVLHFAFAHFGLIEAARYAEPTGKFDGSAGAWDQVVMTASIGGLGYLVGRLLLSPVVSRSNKRSVGIEPPWWYRSLRTPIWVLAAIVFAVIIYANAETGLIVRGYVPRIQLPWPLGALFSWTTDIGFALLLSVLAAWDRSGGAGPVRGYLALCIEGAIISIQTNSRGIYLFHTLPAAVSEARRPFAWRSASGKAGLLLLGIWLAGAITIPLLTTGLRAFGEKVLFARTAESNESGLNSRTPPASAPQESTTTSQKPRSVGPETAAVPSNPVGFDVLESFVGYAFKGGSRLLVDRWPGMEGLMATQSYAGRSVDLLWTAATQRRTYGMVDIYSQKIAGLDFTEEEAKRYHNATLAGPIAFFYYSGSWLIVFGGIALLTILMSALELLWARLVPDPLVTAISCCYLALVVMQLSTGIVQAASGLITLTALLALVWGVARMNGKTEQFLERSRDAV